MSEASTRTLDEIQHEKQLAEDAAQRSLGALPDYEWDPSTNHDSNTAGMQWAMRIRSFPEIFRDYYDPDILAPSPGPPPEVRAAFEDVFPEESKSGKLKIAMHPFMRRWALWERARVPDEGTTENSFVCISLFMEKPVEGEIPADLRTTDKRFLHLRGCIGEFRLPNRGDFEIIKRFDRQRSTAEQMIGEHMEEVLEKRRTEARFHEAYSHDMHGYIFNAIHRKANQDAGSGWNPISHPERVFKQDVERYTREQRKGFVIIHKRSAEDVRAEQEGRDEAARNTALERAANEEAVADAGRSLTLHEAKAILTGEGPEERARRAARAKAARFERTM